MLTITNSGRQEKDFSGETGVPSHSDTRSIPSYGNILISSRLLNFYYLDISLCHSRNPHHKPLLELKGRTKGMLGRHYITPTLFRVVGRNFVVMVICT